MKKIYIEDRDDDLKVKEIGEGHFRYFFKSRDMTSLEVLLKGLFRKEHLLEYIEDFILYDKAGDTYEKKIVIFHQFYTVRKAIERTIPRKLWIEKKRLQKET